MSSEEEKREFQFNRENYKFLIIGAVAILIGFFLMVGGKSEDPAIFDPAVFSPMRISVAPFIVLVGLGIVVYSIMKKSKPAN